MLGQRRTLRRRELLYAQFDYQRKQRTHTIPNGHRQLRTAGIEDIARYRRRYFVGVPTRGLDACGSSPKRPGRRKRNAYTAMRLRWRLECRFSACDDIL
jgi:hypothetical protein